MPRGAKPPLEGLKNGKAEPGKGKGGRARRARSAAVAAWGLS